MQFAGLCCKSRECRTSYLRSLCQQQAWFGGVTSFCSFAQLAADCTNPSMLVQFYANLQLYCAPNKGSCSGADCCNGIQGKSRRSTMGSKRLTELAGVGLVTESCVGYGLNMNAFASALAASGINTPTCVASSMQTDL